MAILVTRPQPDNAATVAALRGKGYETLAAPMLRFEPLALPDEPGVHYGAVIVTSANALRAIHDQPAISALRGLPVFAVGDKTAAAAVETGFAQVISADGDAGALRDLFTSKAAKKLNLADPLLYLAGADLARDLAGELGARGFTVVTHTAYRMVPAPALPDDVIAAFGAGRIAAVLHYSRRSARAFCDAVRTAGVEISALALPHCCLSEAVATVLRDNGATQALAARSPDENALFEMLDRARFPKFVSRDRKL